MNRRTFEEMVSYFNQTVADMDIDQKYKMELLGMITAILQRHDEDMKYAPTIEGRKTGHWERHNTYRGDDTSGSVDPDWRCSECGRQANVNVWCMYDLTDFCPNCGADMRRHDEGTADDI